MTIYKTQNATLRTQDFLGLETISVQMWDL